MFFFCYYFFLNKELFGYPKTICLPYVFLVLAACAREGKFVDNEVVGRMEKGQIKLPGLKEI